MEILELIDRIEDLVEESSSLPFSKKVMVDSEALFFILKEMRENIPEEIKQAEWIHEEKDRILNDATKDASQIKADAESRYEKMINENDVVVAAESKANEIILKAEQNAKTIKMQTNTYVDDVLSKTQEKLRDLITVLDNNRSELRK